MITVAKSGGDFDTIQAAVNSLPRFNKTPAEIFIKNGVYKEKLYIEVPNLTLIGESREGTIVTFDDGAAKIMANGQRMGTFPSYSVFIGSENFTAKNITFKNEAGPGSVAGQALAAYIDGDKTAFFNCSFTGHQDTIFTGPLPPSTNNPGSFAGPRELSPRYASRQYFESCYISGDVDFIFGGGTAYYENCEIYSEDKGSDTNNGYITAASTPVEVPVGYVFHNCRLTSDAAPKSVYLGRPWREYAHTLFLNCEMGAHIKPEGWNDWGRKNAKETVRYEEYGSFGPGGDMSQRADFARVLTSEEAAKYTIEYVLGDWNPKA